MASYLTGTMNSFPEKLTKLASRPEKIGELEQHLVNLKDCFFKVAGQGKTDDQGQEWMKQVRELFFDIEDWIDEKLATPKQKVDQQLRTNMAGPSEGEEEIKETNKVDPSDIEEKIKGFITLTEEACGRCTRYKLVNEPTTSGAAVARVATRVITTDSGLLFDEKPYLIALDHPAQVLEEHLTDNQTELKVVSIVGTGGLGKTTLAKKIHEELQGMFQFGAFVQIGSRHPSILTILVNMLEQMTSKPERLRRLDEQEVIAELWALLKEKRYFIVLDGIRTIRTWRGISCALAPNNLGSRIVITTRMKDVAKSCSSRYTDVIHHMEALSDDDSKKLFDHAAKTQVDDGVLKMCGGIPSAITLAAGLLTGKPTEMEEPNTLGQHMLSSFEQYYSLSPEMTKILHMSYADLSIPLRSCFLYLIVFQEEYTINKDHLIRRWGAEGFIPRMDDESSWVTGERYFNELISRRLIQPVYNYEDDQAVGCTVEPLILDFIRTLSREENFATAAAELSSGQFPCETIRRFSVDCSNEDEAVTFESITEQLSSIRSLTVFGDVEEMPWAETEEKPSPPESRRRPWANKDVHESPHEAVSGDIEGTYFLLPFKLLRVLDLGDAENLRTGHLEGIGGLILLRYLRLGAGILKLPEEIGELQQLETLDLRQTDSVNFSGNIDKLRKLVHILFRVTKIDHLLGMTELEEVSMIDIHITRESAEKLRKLLSGSKRLRILGVSVTLGNTIFPIMTKAKAQWFMSFLEVLAKSNLESLAIHYLGYDNGVSILKFGECWKEAAASAAAKFQPRRFELKLSKHQPYFDHKTPFGRFLPYVDSFGSLTHLYIAAKILKQDGLHILGNMQHLVLLNLSSDKTSLAGRGFVKTGAFPSLLLLSLTCYYGGMCLEFEPGAMPQLRRLVLSFTVSRDIDSYGNFNFGLENLACLTRVHATINCHLATITEIVHAEEEARKILSQHINKPILQLFRYQEWKIST